MTTSAAEPTATAPAVSVIIPVRNDARRLADCLASLTRQNFPAQQFETIVVDNGSSDDSAAVARAAGAQVVVLPDVRVGALRNHGAHLAHAPLLAFVDSDHLVPPDWLAQGVAILRTEPDVTAVGFPYLAPTPGTWVQRDWERHRIRRRHRRDATWLAAGNLFIRRADFLAVDGFRPDLIATEDVDLCVRLAQRGQRLVEDPRVANVHVGEPATLRNFFDKECWRGIGSLRAFFAHGAPLHELPSILYPVYHALAFLALLLSPLAFLGPYGTLALCAAAAALVLPSILMAVRTTRLKPSPLHTARLAVLYLTYGLARALVLFSADRAHDSRGQNHAPSTP